MKYTKDQLRAMAQSVLWRKEHDPQGVASFVSILAMLTNMPEKQVWEKIEELASEN